MHRKTDSAPRRGRLLKLFTGLGAFTAALLLLTQPAAALPPDGPSPNTPGTYVEVWPTTVKHGDVLNFRVTGFPAGEIIHLKYDDGDASVCGSSAVHGACVVHKQVVPSSGVTVGSIIIPADLPTGRHWIRFLASKEVPGGGVLGFTLHGNDGASGNSTFSVVAGAAPGAGAGVSASGGSPGGYATGGGGVSGSTTGPGGTVLNAPTTAGEVAKATPGEVATTEPQAAPQLPIKSASELNKGNRGGVKAVIENNQLRFSVDQELANEWVFVYAYPDKKELGWQQVANDGTLSYPLLELEPGEHKFAVIDVDNALVGWDDLTVDAKTVAKLKEQVTGVPADVADEGGTAVPWVGIAVLAGAVLVAAVIVVTVLKRGSGAAATAAGGSSAAGASAGAANANANADAADGSA